MKLFSEAVEYGLRSVVWLAQTPGEARKVREIAAATRAAPGYLVKALQPLARSGILVAQRGSQGGFTLVRDPAGLTVLDVINAIEPIERIRSCPLGVPSHGVSLCPLHRRIDVAYTMIESCFREVTIAELRDEAPGSVTVCSALKRDAATKDGQEWV